MLRQPWVAGWAGAVGSCLCWGYPFLAGPVAANAEVPGAALLAEYSEEEAKRFLQYARVSFCDDGPIQKWVCGEACRAQQAEVERNAVQLIHEGANYGVKGYVARLNEQPQGAFRCVLAFRGSVSMENWLADAKLFLYDWPLPARRESAENGEAGPASWCPGCQVHEGFAQAYEELRPATHAGLQSLGCSLVDVTGHSLGAAVATLAAMDLRASGVAVRMLWTYGSPRVGNPAFAKAFMNLSAAQGAPHASWRIVHYHDPVPQGGPSESYMHLPRQVFYNRESTNFTVCPPVTWGEDGTPFRPECGMFELGYQDLSGGLIFQDHVTYLNKTLALKHMDEHCVLVNICKLQGLHFTLLDLFLAAAVGALLVGVPWFISVRRQQRLVFKDEDDGESEQELTSSCETSST